MTVINGNVRDIGLEPLSGTLIATSVRFRASGDVVIAPESRSFPIVAGVVSADLVPGPTRLTVRVGSHARDEFDVVVPDDGPVTLATLIEEAFPWEPEQVREFVRLRDDAVAAAERAEQAATGVDDAIGDAADDVIAAVEQDRQRAEDAAEQTGLDRTATGEDREQTGLDREQTGADRVATGEDREATGQDRTAVANDRAQTGLDRQAAAQSATDASGSASAADGSRQAAEDAEAQARAHAEAFDVTASGVTGEPGSETTVNVSGSGPAYHLTVTTPRGDKGEQGDQGEISQAQLDAAVASLVDGAPEALDTLSELAAALGGDPNFATTVSEAIGRRARIDGAPEEYDSLGKLVSALIAGDLGGSTDASVLTGALTDQVDAGEATVESDLNFPGGPGVTTSTVAGWVASLYYMGHLAMEGLESKADVDHTHTPGEVGLDQVDNTSDADKPVSTATQQALDGKEPAAWTGTQAQYDALGSYDPDRTYYVEE